MTLNNTELTLLFTLLVGTGSTVLLDIWAIFLFRKYGLAKTDWGAVGRWLSGLIQHQYVLDNTNTSPFSTQEKTLGWVFHYLVGFAYAAMLPIFWSQTYITHPTFFPAFVIGVVVSSLAGLMILMPGLGGGLFARKMPNQKVIIVYVLAAHGIFAIGQYGMAMLIASQL